MARFRFSSLRTTATKLARPLLGWLMIQTALVRYFVVALLFHIGLLLILASIKIVSVVPGFVATFIGAPPTPPPDSEPPDPFAAYRDFDYNGPSFDGKGGGSGQKGPGGVPTAAGTQAGILAAEARGETPEVSEVIAVMTEAGTNITRPSANPGGFGMGLVSGLGNGTIGSGGIQGPGGPWLGAGRIGPIKSVNLARFGGSAETERAVMAALRWLKQHQQADGSWSSVGGPTAGTSLALLAFLGHGEMTESAEFGVTVQKAIEFLVSHVPANGDVAGNMYNQGLVTLALAEAYAMSQSPVIKAPLDRATQVIVRAQQVPKGGNHPGGWRYSPGSNDSDLSVTGWQIMALKSTANAGIAIPADTLDRSLQYVWRTHHAPGFGYQGGGHTPAMTAVGCLSAQFLGHGDDPRVTKALLYLRNQVLDWKRTSDGGRVMYLWY